MAGSLFNQGVSLAGAIDLEAGEASGQASPKRGGWHSTAGDGYMIGFTKKHLQAMGTDFYVLPDPAAPVNSDR